MRPGKRLSPHLLPGVALVLIALAVLVHPELDRPWLSLAPPSPGPGATPTATLPPALGAPADVLTEAAETVRDAGAGHGPWAPGGYAERYAAGHLGQIAGGAGATYYIAITGTDTANTTCTLAAPCASLSHFSQGQGGPTPVGGDTIDILPGQYNLAYTGGITPTTGTNGLWFFHGRQGSPGNPITIQGIGAVTITREFPATLRDQQVRLLTFAQVGGVNPTNITFQNLTLVGMTARADYDPTAWHTLDPGGNTDGTAASEIEALGSAPVTGDLFDHMTVRDSAVGCFKFAGGPYTIQNSQMLSCGKGNFSHAVYASGADATLTHNVVINGAGASLYTANPGVGVPVTITDNVVSQQAISIAVGGSMGIQSSAPNSLIARNVIYDSYCGGISIDNGLGQLSATHPITVEQNIIANWNVQGLGSCVGLAYASPGYMTVINNSFWGHGWPVQMVSGSPSGPMIVENNIFAAGSAGNNYVCHTGYAGSVVDYNLYYNAPLNTGCQTTFGPHDVHGGASTDPLYWAAPDVPLGSLTATEPLPDLHLRAASPARGVGDASVGLGTDLGAYPYDAGYVPGATPTPLPTAPPAAAGTGSRSSPHVGHRR